jgi:DNA gyrase inhibitor GyrI
MHYASLEMRGPYEGVGRGMVELKQWMDSHGIKPSGKPFALFYDNPTETAAAELRSEACIPVSGPFEAQGRFKSKHWAGGTVAETKHRGPPEDYTRTYGSFLESLLGMEYGLDGPAREIYDEVSESLRPGVGSTIQQAVHRRSGTQTGP